MKVSKAPNRFFPGRAFATEDVNRNLSHASDMIKNDQDARFVYSSIRIPCSVVSERQERGITPEDGGDPAGMAGRKETVPGNSEAIRTFSFVPPFDMHLVSTDFYVKGASDTKTQIDKNDPMVAKVQWITDDGGEGFPPRPKSYLPEGMTPSGDPDLTSHHDQITIEITDQSGFFARTDNGEYTLRGGKCYRVSVSDPDIPTVSNQNSFAYSQGWYWRYKLAWIQLNFKYDKWLFDKINRPDVKFYNASDKVEQSNSDDTGLYDQMDGLQVDSDESSSRRRYPKPELHYFGIGNFNGIWARPVSSNTLGAGGQNHSTAQASIIPNQDSWQKKVIPDLEFSYLQSGGDQVLDIKESHNFIKNAIWRSPMGPWQDEDITRGYKKCIWGWSVGIAHNTTNQWQEGASIEQTPRHLGYNFFATLGHGYNFQNEDTLYPNYLTVRTNATGPDGRTSPAMREQNVTDNGGLAYLTPSVYENLYRNDTHYGSTALPQGKKTRTADEQNDDRPGHASGFPGDYLAEIHSYKQYGDNVDIPLIPDEERLSISTAKGNFVAPENYINGYPFPGSSSLQDFNKDLFTILNTVAETDQNGNFPYESPEQNRNFQKVYVLLWVS